MRRLPDPGTAVVTGAASGLGHAVAALLARSGWRLALVDLPDVVGGCNDVADLARSHGGGAIVEPLDVRDGDAWRRLHDRLRGEWQTCDLLVNSAGVGAAGLVGSMPDAQWRRVIDTNLVGTALGCETFMPWLRSHPGRSQLVNVASIAGIVAPAAMAAYSASKAGVIALSESIAAECPRGRPGVTIVCPGFFKSGLLDTWHFTSYLTAREAVRRMEGSWWTSEAVARRVLSAARRDRRYVVVGATARWAWRLKRLTPAAVTALMRLAYMRLR